MGKRKDKVRSKGRAESKVPRIRYLCRVMAGDSLSAHEVVAASKYEAKRFLRHQGKVGPNDSISFEELA